jgi:hypothetical protein
MPNEHPDRLDLILDAAIRDYSNAEPRAGLERRILRHVQTTPGRGSGWSFAWALAVAATALFVLIALPARHASPPALALLPPPVPQAVPLALPTPAPRQRTSGHRSLRRKDPEPPPLTAEERTLLRLVQERPTALVFPSQSTELEALTIEPLEIEALQ